MNIPASVAVQFVVTALAAALTVAPIIAQETTRLRVTGMKALNLPGQLTVDGPRVSGSAIIGIDEDVVRIKAPDGTSVWTVPRAGKRLTGTARVVEGGVLELRQDGQAQPLFVPLAVIQSADISVGRRKNHGILLGVLAGVGVFYGGVGLAFAQCGLGCSEGEGWGYVGIAGGLVTGVALAHHLRREHWQAIAVSAIPEELARRTP